MSINTQGDKAITEARKTKDRLPFINDMMRHIKEDFDKRTRHCCNCCHFDEPKEICNYYRQRPPARVIATACPTHVSDDEIPF